MQRRLRTRPLVLAPAQLPVQRPCRAGRAGRGRSEALAAPAHGGRWFEMTGGEGVRRVGRTAGRVPRRRGPPANSSTAVGISDTHPLTAAELASSAQARSVRASDSRGPQRAEGPAILRAPPGQSSPRVSLQRCLERNDRRQDASCSIGVQQHQRTRHGAQPALNQPAPFTLTLARSISLHASSVTLAAACPGVALQRGSVARPAARAAPPACRR